jgi:hypothetical protein
MVSIKSIMHNVLYYLYLPADFFSPIPSPARYILYIACIPFFVLGLTKSYKKDFHIIIYISLTFMLYILLPGKQGIRYILPVLPFLVSFSLTSIERYENKNITNKVDWVFKKILSKVPIILIIIVFIFSPAFMSYNNLSKNRISTYGPYSETSMDMFLYIQDNTKSSDIIVFFKPRVMRMMTDRRSIILDDAWEIYKGDYLVLYSLYFLTKISYLYFSPCLSAHFLISRKFILFLFATIIA